MPWRWIHCTNSNEIKFSALCFDLITYVRWPAETPRR